MSTEKTYQHLEWRSTSFYRQPFIKGTRIRVEIPYARTVASVADDGTEEPAETPEQIAADLLIPVAAVLEAVDYCQAHWDVVVADHAREDRLMEARGMNHPNYKYNPKAYYKHLTPEEYSAILNDEPLPG